MEKYIIIDTDDTKLSQLGLTYDLIMDGEHAELDPEVKINKRKSQYVTMETVEFVVDAYSSDLMEAYRANESMIAYIAQCEEDLAQAKAAFETTKGQLEQIMDADENLRTTENLLASLDDQITKLDESKRLDSATIASLRAQMADMEAAQITTEELAAEVDLILDNLQKYFSEEGIDIEA